MSETMAATHINPTQRPMRQCLGIPIFDVDARVVDPGTFAELPPGEIGQIAQSLSANALPAVPKAGE